MDFDVIVLGAGIVGVSAALHLQDRGRRVALVDRRAPGEETSFGNAGLIERSSIVPYGFPRDFGSLLRYACNRSTDLYWDYKALPGYATWLARFWWESAPKRLAQASRDMLPLIGASVDEHDALIARAGLHDLVHAGGWIEAFRTPRLFALAADEAQRAAREHGLSLEVLDRTALRAQEPAVGTPICGAIRWRDPKSVRDPRALVKGYAALFEREGGRFAFGEATSLRFVFRGLDRADTGRHAKRQGGCGGVGPLVGSRVRAVRLPPSATGQARLSHALSGRRACRLAADRR